MQTPLIERTLVSRNVPCVVLGEGSFFEHAEIKLMCACLPRQPGSMARARLQRFALAVATAGRFVLAESKGARHTQGERT